VCSSQYIARRFVEKDGGALSCRVTNSLSRRARKGEKWLVKAIGMVKARTTRKKEK
jgi:hypothetical protein